MVISIANQKGGSQKSTITSIMATAIHYGVKEMNVAVIDADLQKSLFNSRGTEITAVKNSPSETLKLEKMQAINGKELFPIIWSPINQVEDKIKELKQKGFNMIFIDLPGTLEADGLDQVYPLLDYIFIPVYTDIKSQDSTSQFVFKLKKLIIDNPNIKSNIKDFTLFFTKYTDNKNLKDSERFRNLRSSYKMLNLNILDKGFYSASAFVDDFAFTVFPFPKDKKLERISPYPLFEEMFGFMFNNTK